MLVIQEQKFIKAAIVKQIISASDLNEDLISLIDALNDLTQKSICVDAVIAIVKNYQAILTAIKTDMQFAC